MKRSFLLLLTCFLLVILSMRVQAQEADPVLLKEFKFEPRETTTDEELLEIARTADVNFIADATHFSPETMTVQTRYANLGTWPLWLFIMEIIPEWKLTSHRYDAQTFLFWTEPDIVTLAQKVLNGEGNKLLGAVKIANEGEVNTLLVHYLQRSRGWDSAKLGFSLDIKIADLPPEVRTQVIAKVQKEKLGHPVASGTRAILSDDYWQQAVLRIVNDPTGQKRGEVLTLRAGGKYAATIGGVSVLEALQR